MSRYELAGDIAIEAGPEIQNTALPPLMMGAGQRKRRLRRKMRFQPGASKAHAIELKKYSTLLRNEAKQGKATLDILDRYAQLCAMVKMPKRDAAFWKARATKKLAKISLAQKRKLAIAGYDLVGTGLQPPEMAQLQRITTNRGMGHINKGAVIIAQLYGAEQAAKALEAMAATVRAGGLR
jgi:hypothetical protein